MHILCNGVALHFTELNGILFQDSIPHISANANSIDAGRVTLNGQQMCACAVYTSLSPGKRKRSSLEYSRHLTIVGVYIAFSKGLNMVHT
jgi:hypothetical protein